jgi:hypothetical protein
MDGDFEVSPMKTPNNEQTLVEESCFSILSPKKKVFSYVIHDLETHYMRKFYDRNLPITVDFNESMSLRDLNIFTPNDAFQPWFLYGSGNLCY